MSRLSTIIRDNLEVIKLQKAGAALQAETIAGFETLKSNHLYRLRFSPVPSWIDNFGQQIIETDGYKITFYGRRSFTDKNDFYVYLRFIPSKQNNGEIPPLEAGYGKIIGLVAGAAILGGIGIFFLKEIKDITLPATALLLGVGYGAAKLLKVF